jgi:ankyrin repeat protein
MDPHSPRSRISVILTLCRFALAASILLALTGSGSAFTSEVQESPLLSQDPGNMGTGSGQSAASSPAVHTGTLYFYRQARILGKIIHFSAYVDDTFLAEIHNGQFASMEVPEGSVALTAATPIIGKHRVPFGGAWASEPGCTGLKWRRLALEPIADIEQCRVSIRALAGACGITVETCFKCVWKTIHTPRCNYQLSGADLGYELLEQVATTARLKLDIEAGKTYYVRWSLSLTNHPLAYKMEVMDAVTGAKEIKKETLAKETDEGNQGELTKRTADPGQASAMPVMATPPATVAATAPASPPSPQSSTLPTPSGGDASTIFEAAKDGNLERVKALLKDGADLVSSKDDHGLTPLHWAAVMGHIDVAELLLASGAKADAEAGKLGRTPLWGAASSGHMGVAELLLDHGADANHRDTNGQTPLYAAVAKDHKDVAELLLTHGADANARDTKNETPFHAAMGKDQKDVAELLLVHGADINARNYRGDAPLHLAAANGADQLVEWLIANKAEVDARDSIGLTPLDGAAFGGHLGTVKILLAHGADINAKATKEGNRVTPQDMALRGNHRDVAEWLRDHGDRK